RCAGGAVVHPLARPATGRPVDGGGVASGYDRGDRGSRGVKQRMVKAAPAFFCWYARVVAVLSLLTWLSVAADDWILRVDRLGVVYALGWWPSLPFAALMLLLSVGLRRGKRSAWRIQLA